jgi:hypothetical protein
MPDQQIPPNIVPGEVVLGIDNVLFDVSDLDAGVDFYAAE